MSKIYLKDLPAERSERIVEALEAHFGPLGPLRDWDYNQIRHLAYCLPDHSVVFQEYIQYLRDIDNEQ